MHEILLHGKRLDNGEWVEGFYISDLAGKAYICQKVTAMYTFDGARCYGPYIEVDPDTLGRETGLTDRNGKRIFDGDIVKHYNDTSDPSLFDVGAVFWDDEGCSFMRTSRVSGREDPFCVSHTCVYEVIGNIHDNPELLERGRV